ncbi:hypothetical protein PPACK8108_LOCUS4399 [Phakopsora pachyrhizi]|uniref:Uncharacterized protein n=1 Tax=Phakopsora pachyrhizi TaxID=170000 RepID=A0AAV0ALV1_PHAPC|nr:hypothetical protein PPACK8108_LOCUS4399 [Phakopsora pachyrhizi]
MSNKSIIMLSRFRLAAMILVGFFFHIYCLDSLTSADLAHSFKDTQHNTYDFINANLGEAARQSSQSQSNLSKQEPRTGVTKMVKFDLNELPGDVVPDVDDCHFKNISDLGTDMISNSAPNRQRFIPSDPNSSHKTVQPSSMRTNIYSPENYLIQMNNEQRISFDRSLSAHKSKYLDQDTSLEHFKPSHASYITIGSPLHGAYPTEKAFGSSHQHHAIEELKNLNNQPMTTQEYVDLSKKRKLVPTDNLEAVNNAVYASYALITIKQQLSAKIKNSGPFDLEGEGLCHSPYNKQLLKFIEQNLSEIVHESLGNFKIDRTFFEVIKTSLWHENEDILYIDEGLITKELDDQFKNFNFHAGCNWIKLSPVDNYKHSSPHSGTGRQFSFTDVFANFLTFENVARFFFTDDMRLTCETEFEDLDRRLIIKKEKDQISQRTVNNFLTRVWTGLTGFLSYVHAINAIILSDDSLPLTNYKLIEKQREAMQRKYKKTQFDEDKKTWLYIELWMMRYRPELYKIATRTSTNGIFDPHNKFRSFVNKAFFPFFSGMCKYQNIKDIEIFGKHNFINEFFYTRANI